LLLPPFFKNVSDLGIVEYYKAIIHAVGHNIMKVVLYHIPQFTGVPITFDVVKALHEEFPSTIIALKESEGNLAFTKRLVASIPNFKVFVGHERQIIEAVSSGGAGSICGIANVYPEFILSLYQLAKNTPYASNPDQLEKFFAAMGRLNFVAVFKAIMANRFGSKWMTVRPPLVPLTPGEVTSFLASLTQTKLESPKQ